MAYNEHLANRVREALTDRKGVTEKKMFGGHMCCGILKDDLVVRVGPVNHEKALANQHARPMDFTGRSMKGMVYVGPGGYATEEGLKHWLDQGLSFALSLPPKTSRPTRKSRPVAG